MAARDDLNGLIRRDSYPPGAILETMSLGNRRFFFLEVIPVNLQCSVN